MPKLTLLNLLLAAAASALSGAAQADPVSSEQVFVASQPLSGHYAQTSSGVSCDANGRIERSERPVRLEHVTSYVLTVTRSGMPASYIKHLVIHFDGSSGAEDDRAGELLCQKRDQVPGSLTTVEIEEAFGGRVHFTNVPKVDPVDTAAYTTRYDSLYSEMLRYRDIFAETLRKYPPEKSPKKVHLASTVEEAPSRAPASDPAQLSHPGLKAPWARSLQRLFNKSLRDVTQQAD